MQIKKQVQVYLLDCDVSEGTSKSCAAVINFSLSRLDSSDFLQSYTDKIQMQAEVE